MKRRDVCTLAVGPRTSNATSTATDTWFNVNTERATRAKAYYRAQDAQHERMQTALTQVRPYEADLFEQDHRGEALRSYNRTGEQAKAVQLSNVFYAAGHRKIRV